MFTGTYQAQRNNTLCLVHTYQVPGIRIGNTAAPWHHRRRTIDGVPRLASPCTKPITSQVRLAVPQESHAVLKSESLLYEPKYAYHSSSCVVPTNTESREGKKLLAARCSLNAERRLVMYVPVLLYVGFTADVLLILLLSVPVLPRRGLGFPSVALLYYSYIVDVDIPAGESKKFGAFDPAVNHAFRACKKRLAAEDLLIRPTPGRWSNATESFRRRKTTITKYTPKLCSPKCLLSSLSHHGTLRQSSAKRQQGAQREEFIPASPFQ